jgi:beta-glucosidase
MSLGGGVDLTRDPRNGRTFEYPGEDPVLAGTMAARLIAGIQSQHIIGDIKHYALNDQESGRGAADVHIGERAARESDLLAFEIGVEQGHPGAVMCAYNRVNGVFSCESDYLLKELLKKDWNLPGIVPSDWGGTHSLERAAAAGLDQEEGGSFFYGERYQAAVQSGSISMSELDEHVHRILRSMFATGVIDNPRRRNVVDPFAGLVIARTIEEDGMVLLKNDQAALPLDATKLHTIAVIGAHSDAGMISGGGSAQVDPPGENAFVPSAQAPTPPNVEVWFPTSPPKAIQEKALHALVKYDSGADPAAAAAMAKDADVAIVFAYQWESEGSICPIFPCLCIRMT